jgi:tetratricopeptide (TPR) repeat protein
MTKKHFVLLLAGTVGLRAEAPAALVQQAMLALGPSASRQDIQMGEAGCRRALELANADSADAAAARNTLGAILETQGRFAEARAELEIALRVRERLFGPGTLVAETLDKLGLVYREQGHLDGAEALYRRAIEMLRPRPGVELGTAFNNLGNALAAAGQLEEAEGALRQAIEVYEKVLGPEHPNIAAALSNLSSLERIRHHYAQAERLLEQALKMDRKMLPAGSVRIGLDLNNAGTLFAVRKHYADAEGALRDSLSILRGSLPGDHPEIGRVSVNLGIVLRLERKTTEGDERYWEGIEILTRAWGPRDARLLALLRPYQERATTEEPTGYVGQTIAFRRLPYAN